MKYTVRKANFDPTGSGYIWYDFVVPLHLVHEISAWCNTTFDILEWSSHGYTSAYMKFCVQGEKNRDWFLLKWSHNEIYNN